MLESGGSVGAGDGIDEREHPPDQLLPGCLVASLGAARQVVEVARLRRVLDFSKQVGDLVAAAAVCGCRERFPCRGSVLVHGSDRATKARRPLGPAEIRGVHWELVGSAPAVRPGAGNLRTEG